MKKFLLNIWSSSTLMTWGSFFAQSISLLIVLPLLLTRFSTEEIALWYLFMTLIGFQRLADLGFSPTFSRSIAYAMGGASVVDLKLPRGLAGGECNQESLGRLCATMRYLYTRLGLGWTLLLGLVGSFALQRPISFLADPTMGWLAWGVVLLFSFLIFRGSLYSAVLQGTNRIAELRRYEMLISLFTMGAMALLLLLDCQFLSIITAHQVGRGINVVVNWWLAKDIAQANAPTVVVGAGRDFEVLAAVWPSAWRSGLGKLLNDGFMLASGVIYAQFGPAEMVATYLLTLRLFDAISQFSQAPFYSKLPIMAKCFAEGQRDKLLKVAENGMHWSYWSYVVSFIGLGLTGGWLLKIIGSNANFPSAYMWIVFGVGYFAQRFGAMHIQLYSNTNHILWHVVNGVTGALFIITSLCLYPFAGVYAFPVGFFVAHVFFYARYCSAQSYREYGISFDSFDRNAIMLPLIIMFIYVFAQLFAILF